MKERCLNKSLKDKARRRLAKPLHTPLLSVTGHEKTPQIMNTTALSGAQKTGGALRRRPFFVLLFA